MIGIISCRDPAKLPLLHETEIQLADATSRERLPGLRSPQVFDAEFVVLAGAIDEFAGLESAGGMGEVAF